MSKTLTNKVRLILVLALVMVVSVCASMFAFSKAEAEITSVDELTTFKMESTSIFYDEEDGKVGLNFTASISTAEYDAIQALGAETGLVIAPENYVLTEANLFGNDAIFGWAEYVDGEWLAYEGEGYQVINIYTNDWKAGDGVYTYSGAIVDIKEQNVGKFFQAVAYVVADEVYNFSDAIVTSTAFEVSKLGDDVPAYVPENWDAYEAMEEDMGIVAPEHVGENGVLDFATAPAEFTVKLVDNNGNEITEGVIDFNLPENQRQWTMIQSYQGVAVIKMTFDVVDENGLFVWNEEVSIGSVDAVTYEGAEKTRYDYDTFGKGNVTEVEIEGVDYITYEASGGNGTWFAWKPLHSKEYYEAWAGKGITFTATLAVDASGMKNPADESGVLNQTSVFATSGPVAIKEDVTITQTTTLEDILANWDKRVDCAWDGQWGTRYPSSMIYVYNVHNGGKIAVTFGVDVPADAYANKGGDILVNVEEVADLTALDLTSKMDPAHVAKLEVLADAYDLTYSLKGYSIADEIEVTDLTKVDVSSAKLAAYDLVVSSGDNIFYTARIDLYNTTDAVVWAESLTKENVVLRKAAHTVGAYYTENVEATFIDKEDFEIVDTFTTDKEYVGSFISFSTKEAMNLSIDIKALHSKTYYNEMIGDSTKILHLRAWASANTTAQILSGMNNFGMNNAFTSRSRQGFSGNKLESFVFAMDNMLIANSADETYNGNFYDWNNINGTNVGMARPMITIEVSSSMVEKGAWSLYFGIYGDQIVDGGETLATLAQVTGREIDLSEETTFDLINLLPEVSHAKFKAMAAKWNGQNGKYLLGNAVGFELTINGTKIAVAANEDGEAILDLDAYAVIIVEGVPTLSDTVKVGDLLNEGNNSVSIRGFAPPAQAGHGAGSWPVYMVAMSTINIVGPAAPVAE